MKKYFTILLYFNYLHKLEPKLQKFKKNHNSPLSAHELTVESLAPMRHPIVCLWVKKGTRYD
jgi:hypothetical protein